MEDDRQERKKETEEGNAKEVKRVEDVSYIYRKWLHILVQYLMVAAVLVMLIYMWKNIEYAKMFTNSCALCMDQHNLTCFTPGLKQIVTNPPSYIF